MIVPVLGPVVSFADSDGVPISPELQTRIACDAEATGDCIGPPRPVRPSRPPFHLCIVHLREWTDAARDRRDRAEADYGLGVTLIRRASLGA